MRTDKSLVVIGASDEDTAHLRLLIRKAAEQLQHRWRWGTETGADLMIVDPDGFAGQMARTRALASGMRCAVIAKAAASPNELLLQRPLRLENVVDVLNSAGSLTTATLAIESGHVYLEAIASEAGHGPDDGPAYPPLTPRGTEPPALGFDELFKVDEAAEKPKFRVPLSLDGDTRLEVVDEPSARSFTRANDSADALTPHGRTQGPNVALPAVKRATSPDGSRHALRTYLSEPLLGGPAQIVRDGAPALTLDPKHREFYTAATLGELEHYLREPLARTEWRALTTAEFGQVRDAQPARPYQRLDWLDALVNSAGRLAPQLDPGGTYRLKRPVEIGVEYRHHDRIVRAMNEPARLNEIAAKAGVPMGDVFDVVNAYHAIGEVEWQSRASLREPPKTGGDGKGGLLSRLKRPFGR